MARIPDTEIERLRNEVSVARLVEASGIELKRGGKDMLGRCPFHEDDTASLVVTPAKNLWHCTNRWWIDRSLLGRHRNEERGNGW
jgi:DNA primase